MRRMLALFASLVAGVALAVPAGGAHAAAGGGERQDWVCPQVDGVCTWSEQDGQGELKILFDGEALVVPAMRSVRNQTGAPWCFFDAPGYAGTAFQEVAPGEAATLGFISLSARPGFCP